MNRPLSLIGVYNAQEDHEKLCADRWDDLREEISRMRRDIDRLWKVIITAAGALIAGEAWLIVELILRNKP